MEEKTVAGRLSRDLEVVKNALACILQEENPLPPHDQQARDHELSRRLSSHGSISPSNALDSRDVSIISRLLHQVQLLEGRDGEDLSTKLGSLEMSTPHNDYMSSEKNMVETVVQIASAAAEAAKAAAASSGKNLEVMETLLSTSEKTTEHRHSHSGSQDEEDEIVRRSLPDKDLVKRLEKQNLITHCVLGFMIVATAVWRYKLLSMFIGVRKSFSNPFQTFGEMVSEGLKGGNKEDQNATKGLNKARAVIPSLLGGEEKEISKVEKTEHSTTKDFKMGEALPFSLDNILSVGKSNHDSAE